MSQPKITRLGSYTATGTGQPVVGADGDHTATLTVIGSGAISATAALMGSNDLVGWTLIANISASGTNTGSGAAATSASYAYWRLDVSALTAGATATGHSGNTVTLIFASTPTVTDGGNLKLAGNFVATADDTLTLACDGTNWYEVCRSVN